MFFEKKKKCLLKRLEQQQSKKKTSKSERKFINLQIIKLFPLSRVSKTSNFKIVFDDFGK